MVRRPPLPHGRRMSERVAAVSIWIGGLTFCLACWYGVYTLIVWALLR